MSTGFFRSTIGSATVTGHEACARLVPRLRVLAIFEGLWSLRGRMVDRVGSRRVGPQFAVHESLRCDAATFIRTYRTSVCTWRTCFSAVAVGRRALYDECVIPPFRLLVYRQEMDDVVPTLVDNYSKRYDFWRRSYFCPHGPHRQWSISAVVAHKVAVQWS